MDPISQIRNVDWAVALWILYGWFVLEVARWGWTTWREAPRSGHTAAHKTHQEKLKRGGMYIE